MIRDDATERQVNAAEPGRNTWLSANAGSGKTRVLTDRVARLLLADTDPQNILCLTYTKAAASEMQNRLFKRLGAWSMLGRDALREELRQLGVDRALDADFLDHARTLFARAIETPGGLKIQTIHAFCAGVLRRFPLEAHVSPQFREMEDQAAEILRTEVVDALAIGPDRPALDDFLAHFTGFDLHELTAEIAKERMQFLEPADPAKIGRALGAPEGMSPPDLLREVFTDDAVQALRDIAKVCAAGTTTEIKAAQIIATCNLSSPRAEDLVRLENLFLFGPKTKNPFGPKIDAFPTKTTRAAHPELTDALNALMAQIADQRQIRLALIAKNRAVALHTFAHAFVKGYGDRKLALGVLDYDDLVQKAAALLSDPDVAQWVLFRLDGGIDHVLVDEAQDTSPTQWAVIRHLTREFAAGEGARTDKQRTVFVVGDQKQSIYSFQGADPAEFNRMQAHFDASFEAAGNALQQQVLQHSFRSSQAILRAVDSTFDGRGNDGLGGKVFHTAFKDKMPGRVDLWAPIEKAEATPREGHWYDPVDHVDDTHHDVQLANQIAAQIKYMIRHETLPVEIGHSNTYHRRPITEGDFLILVQRRSDLFSEIIRACNAAGLNVSGADRFRVGAVLAVKDIAAVLRFLALPEDDLSLACALRSPLFGMTEQDLFALAHYRPDKGYLWAALRDSGHQHVLTVLNDLMKNADFLRPFDVIERLLTKHDGRRKLLARLGTEAEDGIDAMQSQALAYESNEVPSLTGFLRWMDASDLEIKRQMDSQGDRIRVMTVHGAKGLEAPIVILPDTAKRPNPVRRSLIPIDGQLFWKPAADEMPDSLAAANEAIKTAQQEERMRLLYVAMTRAEKWLIIAAAGDVGTGAESWYNIVAEGIAHADIGSARSGDLIHDRMQHLDWDALPLAPPPAQMMDRGPLIALDPLPEVTRTRVVSPSDLGGAKIMPEDPAAYDEDDAKARGRLIHLLLEHLPNIPADRRFDQGRAMLDAADDIAGDPDDLVLEVMALIADPALADIFVPEALAEVPVTALLGALSGIRMHGVIDRLIVTPTDVLAIDYKSNRVTPAVAADTPEGILRQMGAYSAALGQIYPDRIIRTAILWTQTAQLMALPDDLVSNALARVTVP